MSAVHPLDEIEGALPTLSGPEKLLIEEIFNRLCKDGIDVETVKAFILDFFRSFLSDNKCWVEQTPGFRLPIPTRATAKERDGLEQFAADLSSVCKFFDEDGLHPLTDIRAPFGQVDWPMQKELFQKWCTLRDLAKELLQPASAAAERARQEVARGGPATRVVTHENTLVRHLVVWLQSRGITYEVGLDSPMILCARLAWEYLCLDGDPWNYIKDMPKEARSLDR